MMERLLKSFTRPDVVYRINKEDGHCTCNGFSEDGWCKHLQALGRYKPRRVTLTSKPSFYQALSGLVKGIRVRQVTEAAYWLHYCWQYREKLPGSQFRTVRRLLIGSAEDGHSIAVMERMADAFIPLLSHDARLEDAIAELIRICKAPNWWHPDSGGPDYIYASLIADRRLLQPLPSYGVNDCLHGLEEAINCGDKVGAMYWILMAGAITSNSDPAIGAKLFEIAQRNGHPAACRLLNNIYLRHAKKLGADNNFLCQAAWLLAGGDSPILDQSDPVSPGEVAAVIETIHAMTPHVIPGWCCDGIHCAGNDVRYAGMIDRMYAVCLQYAHYQRVNPDDPWLEDEFYCFDGLPLIIKLS